ncbi:MAG TPA: Si-specific NAD(P)(+) transhydrogenase [Gemmatimonadaceae bacterium]|nr:Si-specific NAD(P)(+) transhydrogenase [Gemmatimonadaceae bacterium]
METFDYDLVCVGSGPAGQRGAVQAAKMGRRVALIEKRGTLGGICLDTGTIPSKTFREAVVWAVGAARMNGAGARPQSRPAVDQLLARVGEVVQREGAIIANQLSRNGVEVLSGEASFVDPHRLRIAGADGWREITAANVLIATGTQSVAPPMASGNPGIVITSDEITSLARLPRSLVVVGAGVIGIEYASMFAALGVEVTVIDRRDRPLEFLDSEIVDELIHQMRKRNVVFRLGEAVESLTAETTGTPRAVITLESGKRIVADAALFAVGRIGATQALALDRAGLAADDRGRIAVNKEFRTSVPHIFAAGDVIGYPSLAATSSEQGRLAACSALGAPAPPMAAHFPIGIYAVPEISMVGATESELTKQRVPYEVGVARYREIARGQIVGDDSGFFKMLFHRDDRRLLGVHIIGTGATELLHIGQAVIGLGGGLDYFLTTVFNYPTLAECYKVAALNAANKLAS